MASLCRGRIVWAWMNDRQGGNRKCRPGIIVSRDSEIVEGGDVWVVGVTTDFDRSLGEIAVNLPWDPQHQVHPKTKLKVKSYAICDWLVKIRAEDIEDLAGVLPGRYLLEILRKIADLPKDKMPSSLNV